MRHPTDTDYTATRRHVLADQRGFSILQMVIVVAIIGIVSTFAVISFRRSKDSIALQNSIRLLAGRIEKARVDAVRRHGTSSIQFTNASSYNVTMDFNNNGTPVTRSYALDSGAHITTAELPTITFNWRGNTVTAGTSCVTTFSVVGNSNDSLSVDVSGSGDVTVESNQPTLPTVTYAAVNSNTSVKTQTAVVGTTTVDNTPCMDDSSVGLGGDSGPPTCNIHLSSTTISVRKNGGSTGSVVVSMSTPSLVATAVPSNLTVSPGAAQNVSTGTTFSVISKNNQRGPFNVTFSSACGSSITLRVNVTN